MGYGALLFNFFEIFKIAAVGEIQEPYSQHFIFFVLFIFFKIFKINAIGNVQGMFSQHFILFATHKWAQYDRVLNYSRLGRLASVKHSSLLGPFVSCEENEVL